MTFDTEPLGISSDQRRRRRNLPHAAVPEGRQVGVSDIYGRIGYAHSEPKFNASGPLGAVANSNNRQDEATYGAGVRWTFAPNWARFGEWIKNGRIRIDSYVGGVDFRF